MADGVAKVDDNRDPSTSRARHSSASRTRAAFQKSERLAAFARFEFAPRVGGHAAPAAAAAAAATAAAAAAAAATACFEALSSSRFACLRPLAPRSFARIAKRQRWREKNFRGSGGGDGGVSVSDARGRKTPRPTSRQFSPRTFAAVFLRCGILLLRMRVNDDDRS